MKSRATAMKKGLILFNHLAFINAIKIEKHLFALKFHKSTQIQYHPIGYWGMFDNYEKEILTVAA